MRDANHTFVISLILFFLAATAPLSAHANGGGGHFGGGFGGSKSGEHDRDHDVCANVNGELVVRHPWSRRPAKFGNISESERRFRVVRTKRADGL